MTYDKDNDAPVVQGVPLALERSVRNVAGEGLFVWEQLAWVA